MPSKAATFFAHSHVRHTHRPSLLGTLLRALSIWRERRQLAKLDEHLLRDLGLTRFDVENETNRAFWDAPNRWMR